MPDPRVFFLRNRGGEEVPLGYLRQRGGHGIPEAESAAEVAPGVRIALMGTGDFLLPDSGGVGWGALVAVWAEPEAVEWGVRFAPGPAGRERRDFHEVATPGEAEARDAVAGMQEGNPHWEARVVCREKARPAGPWNEEEPDHQGGKQ